MIDTTEVSFQVQHILDGIPWGWLLSAIISIIAILTAWKIHKEKLKQNRAYITPNTDPGGLIIGRELVEKTHLSISIKNSGLNPANDVRVTVYSYNRADINGTNQNVEPIISKNFVCNNPLATKDVFNIKLGSESHGFDLTLMASQYLITYITYRDEMLNKKFNNTFYWVIGDDDKLQEVSIDEKKIIMELLDE